MSLGTSTTLDRFDSTLKSLCVQKFIALHKANLGDLSDLVVPLHPSFRSRTLLQISTLNLQKIMEGLDDEMLIF